MRLRFHPFVPLVAMLAGCGHQAPGVYDVPRAEAWQRLQQADLAGFIAARGCGVALTIAVKPGPANVLHWTVQGEGAELVHFGVRLEDAGSGKTRAQLDFPFNPELTETLTAPSGAPALRQPLQGAAVELVDAALNARNYDPARAGDDRSQEEACRRSTPKPASPFTQSTAEQPATAFGAPTAGSAQPAMEASPPVLHDGEQSVADLPKPGR